MSIGIIEGFFGPQWSHEARLAWSRVLKDHGGEFYIYAPKQDAHLRKNWRTPWSDEYTDYLASLAEEFHREQISFGLALSPFGLKDELTASDKKLLQEKLLSLSQLQIDILGIFFDDMPVSPGLAKVQIEVVSFMGQHFKGRIIFCPTFYSFDPILEKVFGKMPENYWNDLAVGLPPQVEIAWTGPKVISPLISLEHLKEVQQIFKRKIFLWENLFANDGPKNCKFLKLKAYEGRAKDLVHEVTGIGLNLMNQPYLSQISFLATVMSFREHYNPESLFHAVERMGGNEFAQFVQKHEKAFIDCGLDNLSPTEISLLKNELAVFSHPFAREIREWLDGKYLVGSDCLTD
jgi:hyaluronoglucosaminidase